ncbi:organic cation transporter protein [Anoplophora glabripennis]|uniref:organic cation transporter protein n=1 Tax=Anoplophora glabripennis TaxID=217634 RepID=UPI000873DE78|nr:organic cation transporter protein [Anoplophora glabripennis]
MPDDKKKTLEEEEDIISKAIGEFGKWQLLVTFLLSLFNIPCTWHIFAPTFHSAEKETWCSRPDAFRDVAPSLWKNCTGQTLDFCSMLDVVAANVTESDLCASSSNLGRIQCHGWEFGGQGQTIISEFNLVCDRKSLTSLAEMMFLAGVAIGGLVCGIISDKYGRKRTLMASVLIQSLLGTAIAFSPWFLMYAILRAALGFISVSVVFSGFVLSIELVGGHWRTVAGISYLFPVSLSYMSIAGIAWLLNEWRQLQLAISLPGFLFLGLWWILPESPRWLLAVGRTQEVMVILEKAAKANGRDLPPNIDKQLLPESPEEPAENVNVLDLFKTAQMRKKTVCLFLIWFSVYLVYYGLVLNLANIGGNLYVNSVLQGAVEIPAVAISIFILLKGGRRWPLSLTMIISGVACACTLPLYLFHHLQWATTSLAMLSKFCISSSNAVMPVFTAELYPTTIRNIGVGAANVSAGIALMLVPYLWDLSSIHTSVPMSMLAFFGIFGGLSVLFLPETGGVPLIETIKEVENVKRMNEAETSESKRINNNCCT